MKKVLILALALTVAIALAACGGGSNNNAPSTPANNTPANNTPASGSANFDFSGIGGGVLFTDIPAADRPAFIAEGKKQGLDITFQADGSVKFVEIADGSAIVQNADGTWTVETDDGAMTVDTSGSWPDNKFTKLVPKPDFTVIAGAIDETTFTVTFENTSIDQIKAYVEKVKAAGFNIDEELTDMDMAGMAVYSFSAYNADDYNITVYSTQGFSGFTISK